MNTLPSQQSPVRGNAGSNSSIFGASGQPVRFFCCDKGERMTTTDTQVEPAFTVAELAEKWNCHRRTVRRLIDRGELNAFTLGRDFRVSADAVRRFEAALVTEARR